MASGDAGGESRWAGRSVLVLDHGFLKSRRGKPVHGVELFRLMLVEQMAARGVRVTLAAERSWERALAERWPAVGTGPRPEVLWVPPLGGTVTCGVWAAAAARGRGRFDAVLLGNPRRGLIPTVHLAARLGLGRRVVALAHRHARGGIAPALRRAGVETWAVSEDVARTFREQGCDVAGVMYGLPNAERFEPRERGPGAGDGVTRFCLLGRLPNVSKGHDRAVAAFRVMPADLRARCELHLTSFVDEASVDVEAGDGVVVHTWMPPAEVPAFLRRMDVMLAISSNETFSQAIVQGMLSGLAVIATPLEVYREKLETGGGIVLDAVRDTDELALRMAELATDPARVSEMGAIGRRTALERYVWSTDRFLSEVLFREGERAGGGR